MQPLMYKIIHAIFKYPKAMIVDQARAQKNKES